MQYNEDNARRLYVHFLNFGASSYLRTVLPARRLAKLCQDDILVTESRIFPKDKSYVKNGVLLVQRLAGQENLDLMKLYLNNSVAMNYKIVYDIDDLITEANALAGGREGDGCPEYNVAGLTIDRAAACVNLDIMRQCHIVTVSTETLKCALLDKGLKNVQLVPNRLNEAEWDVGDKARIPRKKPLVLYNGGFSHWREKTILPNRMVLSEHPGDFEGWVPFLQKWIKNNWMEFHVICETVPWFLKDVESQVVRHDVVPYMDYPMLMKKISPDFVLCPLAENKFNKCKSDLKAMEAVALNSIPFGTVFSDNPLESGPYGKWSSSMVSETSEIEDKFSELMKLDKYAEIVEGNIAKKKSIWLDDEFVVKTVKPAWSLL